MSDPKKICIIGVAGSGKTTLARRLSSELGLPHIDMDKARYPGFGAKVPASELHRAAAETAAREGWIAEGSYTDEMEPLFKSADVIYWLDTGVVRSAYRIIRRHVIHAIRGQLHFSATSTLRLAYEALRSHRRSTPANPHLSWMEEIAQALEPYQEKVQKVTNHSSIQIGPKA